MVDVLLASLLEAIKANSDLSTGNADLTYTQAASSRFIRAMVTLIDQRIDLNIEDRKKFKNFSQGIIYSAPPPLEDIDLYDQEYIKEWFGQYKNWYESKKST